MAGKENGAIAQGLEKWQTLNKITLAAGIIAWAVGAHYAIPWLQTLGKTTVIVDSIQFVGVEGLKRLNSKREKTVFQASKTVFQAV